MQVGVTGFCMGGALSFLGAEYAGLDAAAPFYGTPPAELGHVCATFIPALSKYHANPVSCRLLSLIWCAILASSQGRC